MSVSGAVEKNGSMTTATKTFRGRTLEELLPQIKADLGPDAEIIRQREGLTGGVGGFFQRACVEVEARPGEPEERPQRRFDAYDDEPAMPEPLAVFEADPLPEPDESMTEGLEAPGIQEILRQAAPFIGADRKLRAIALDPLVEQEVAESITATSDGEYLAMEPTRAQALVTALRDRADGASSAHGTRPVLLCSARVRRHLRRLCEQTLPNLAVCSYNEIVPGIRVETVGIVEA